jgi:hypothetical protein
MIPIDFQQAPLPHRPTRNAPEDQQRLYQAQLAAANINIVALERLKTLRHELDAEQDPKHPRPLRVVVDGRFTNTKLLKNLPPNTTLIGRTQAPTPQKLLADPSIEFQNLQAQLGSTSS